MQQSKTNQGHGKAGFCAKTCPICRNARKQQKGASFWFVKNVEGGLCPACKAYEKAYGHKAHEPLK
jgi:hypothetical protein